MTDFYTKAMFGQNAFHIPAWSIFQKSTNDKVSFVGATTSYDPFYGEKDTHILIVGDLVFRPHIAVVTNELAGTGLVSFLTNPWQNDAWLRGKQIIGDLDLLRHILHYE